MDAGEAVGLPEVPMTTFKVNPAGYLTTGAVVTSHGKPRAAFVPIDGAPSRRRQLDEIKSQLRMLVRLAEPESASLREELEQLAAARGAEQIGAAQ